MLPFWALWAEAALTLPLSEARGGGRVVSGKRIVEWPFIPLEAYVQQLLWHRGRGEGAQERKPFSPTQEQEKKRGKWVVQMGTLLTQGAVLAGLPLSWGC